jgi:dienelactone hydrolase
MTTLAILIALFVPQPLAAGAVPWPVERVTITTPAGTMLVGYYRDAGANAPAVLFFPMCREDAMDGWAPVADRLRAVGVSSLTITERGFGEALGPSPSGDPRPPDADGAFAYLRSRVGPRAAIAVAGSSCGVYLSLLTASRHVDAVRAAVTLTGPYSEALLAHVRKTAALAVFAGAARDDGPAAGWARALEAASPNPASQLAIADGKAHGTDIFIATPGFAADIAAWLADRLTAESRR